MSKYTWPGLLCRPCCIKTETYPSPNSRTLGQRQDLKFPERKNKSHKKDQESGWHRVLNSNSGSQGTMEIASKIPRKRSCQPRSTRGQTAEARRTTVLQPVEGKPHSQRDGQNEKERTLYQMKEQDKTPEKGLPWWCSG